MQETQETQVRSLGQEDPLEEEMVTHSSILAQNIPQHLNAEFQRIARRDKKAFFSDQCKEIEETTEWERLEISQENYR